MCKEHEGISLKMITTKNEGGLSLMVEVSGILTCFVY